MKKTPLFEIHKELGARLIEFHGWSMPVQYTSIIEEHKAVRNQCGLFDVSHMGEILVEGPGALESLQKIVTNNVARLKKGQVLYTPMCKDDGGIIDDLLVYCLGQDKYLMVVNASNIEKDFNWVRDNSNQRTEVVNESDNYALLALQGPNSKKILEKVSSVNLDSLKFYNFTTGTLKGAEVLISRTGYTGELGYELYLSPDKAVEVWQALMEAGSDLGLIPAGLGARDTLRLEKGYCLYGNDIDENTHPLEAGLGWTVKFDKASFIGKRALLKYKEEGLSRKLVGFKLKGRGIPRHGYPIKDNGDQIGVVTSGSMSPTLSEGIGMGYVRYDKATPGESITIVVRNRAITGEVVKLPFI
ncbi:glycine cleavage system aminomethyltransferase GcvT [Halothermothrix orenii]|uniref:Aminomethyltransferase n=1 Tax=Halothermothrix orenii (strain H 168 / OCM 544 / DSM 9562) TaxID=373903 RepID=GCST_HALOH|nr:glycine cleavage system aminomethyltransferase GcvT [Halothermothrix orenii]B8D1D7.1 RecName: Full=Aminomethyltransferase; AltName: Full=Glycine cleavage system T protein [Halothermothrix orenii H 168]ACL71089.1 glycine cleavage system T protein [Halothermothrix orenii H 168]